MSIRSWLIIILALAVLFPFHVAADEPPASEPEETVVDEIPEETELPQETENQEEPSDHGSEDPTEGTVAPAGPTVAPFDFVLLEESSVQAVERLDQVIQILSGLLFFLGMCAGMLFFKVLADRVRSV